MAQSNQDDLIEFLKDPETIKRAVEGSMEKRLKVMAQSNGDAELEEAVLSQIRTHMGVGEESLMPLNATKRIMQLILADRKQHELDARELELFDLVTTMDEVWNLTNYKKIRGYVVKRIDELKKQREAL